MDTSTHLVMGIGLFGLAHLDPSMGHTETATAVLAGTVIGSQAPDSDTIYRLFSNSLYIRKHRGFSHSLPMLLLWPILITSGLLLIFPTAVATHLWLWTWLAVAIHIFIDLFNAYGTQALRPFSQKWISWNIINIFDPFIFTLHLVGILLWSFHLFNPGIIFAIIYLIMILYIGWRTITHQRLQSWVQAHTQEEGRFTITPTYRWTRWNVVLKQNDRVRMGEIRQGQLIWTGQILMKETNHPAIEASKRSETIQAFLSFTSYGYPILFNRPYGYEIRWLDVRYHHKKHFPFVAVVLLDHQYQAINSYVGWVSRTQLEKKVERLLSS
ncbi:inner membrane protein [Seinonella peptonophila]|uniref:Inner membrane protein n=1 Tax=Seinonella peptonophila TaxID=112248 RepID=A0A1M4ZJ51_9BACL|nr:metal-dependent hydrolase [Seinonella peptonophila]SHF17576.1 inner membrane protein [Seinonella peptonophila]